MPPGGGECPCLVFASRRKISDTPERSGSTPAPHRPRVSCAASCRARGRDSAALPLRSVLPEQWRGCSGTWGYCKRDLARLLWQGTAAGVMIPRVLGGRPNEQWISQYGSSHRHPVNRLCHTLGIPTILLSIPVFVASIFFHRLWVYALALFLIGWVFQFIGHAFEGKPPEFFHDWRFLLVGVRWWWAKIHGRA